MPKTRTKRDSDIPRGSQYVDGQLIHLATNQKLFARTHVCTVFRETLRTSDQFSKQNAVRVMEKNLKKRQAHGMANILEDRFTLEKAKSSGKEPFRSWLAFREIADIQRSKSKPEYFVMSVDSELSHQKYYEVYKCKSKEDAYKFESFIKQALADPDFRVRDGPVLDVVPVNEDPGRVRSIAHLEFQTSLESLHENERTSTMYQATSPTPPMGYDREPSPLPSPSPSPPPVRVRTPISPVVQRQPVVMAAAPAPVYEPSPPPKRRSPSPDYRMTRTKVGLDDLTYISFDSRTRNPYESKEGPVYMYLSRQLSQPDLGRESPKYSTGLYNGRASGGYAY
ncbi:hypothetical protein FBUS_03624 [Fasciolopsis buskii]|uniref:Trematode PH-like domain-containing protein n=1 Tax=Fasciolopsis buskii TaxID=27845 RepID=A0A8E0RSE3_9TREM|nr:hypothetical protein FBUS_03624 [Fasciolopsis buski]